MLEYIAKRCIVQTSNQFSIARKCFEELRIVILGTQVEEQTNGRVIRSAAKEKN